MRFCFLFVVLVLLWVPVSFAVESSAVNSASAKIKGDMDLPEPFGAELFQGNFAKGTFDELNPEYQIVPGDRIAVRLWGARNFDSVLAVDAQGNLFLPEIGPVMVGGVSHSALAGLLRDKIKSVYTKNVEVYTNLINTQPVAVFVTGFVVRPGRYAGGATDSVLYYLDLAGGIDVKSGSYRNIQILRNGEIIERVDLYPFILEGALPRPRLEEGDMILVGERGAGVMATGQIRHQARFEFLEDTVIHGEGLNKLASVENKASHASIIGTRNGAPFNTYLPLEDFSTIALEDGDTVEFLADTPGNTIMVAATGAIIGASRYPVPKSTRLYELMKKVAVEPELANIEGIHIRRRSVALQQKEALENALNRLQESSLKATSQGAEEANIRVREAELISQFVDKARDVQPDGTVVVYRGDSLSDIYLENGDVVVIPAKSDVVLISGEVLMPRAVVHAGKTNFEDYITYAGGFSDRADKDNILVVKPNGEVQQASETNIAAGDQISVLPRVDSKNLQVLKDISQILYQIAIAAKVALTSW